MSIPNGHQRRPRILFAVTGSVAAVKGPEIAIRLVKELGFDVRILLTHGGENFWSKAKDYNQQYWNSLQYLLSEEEEENIAVVDNDDDDDSINSSPSNTGRISMCYADDEWKEWQKLGDPVLHINLRDWADLLLVAPLSAHTLAKISNGLCDDTLSCVLRAWDYGHGLRPGKPLLLAPAMNTAMWEHPLTKLQLQTIQGFWNTTDTTSRRQQLSSSSTYNDDESNGNDNNTVHIISPQVKNLACGEIGNGALASVDEILKVCRSHAHKR